MVRMLILLISVLMLAIPVQAAGQFCQGEGDMRSIEGVISTAITFVNNTGQTVRLYWLNYQGRRQLYTIIAPGRSHYQQTYVTHPWVVTNQQEDCVNIYMPMESPIRILIGE